MSNAPTAARRSMSATIVVDFVLLRVVVLGTALAAVVALGPSGKALHEVTGQHLEVVEETGQRRLPGTRLATVPIQFPCGSRHPRTLPRPVLPASASAVKSGLSSGPLPPARIEILPIEKQSNFHRPFSSFRRRILWLRSGRVALFRRPRAENRRPGYRTVRLSANTGMPA